MLASNVIRPLNSPWASPVVMVRKKDGSLRFCIDFRQLNVATIKDARPLPRVDDLLDALHGAKWFSTLDLKSGYWQVAITEQDKAKTTFWTSSGQLYEFNQVHFGLCNTPATFSRLMDRVLADLHWETCLFYLDDIIVFSSSWEEHLARLCQVFERLRYANLKLGADKCTFAAKEVNYLGHWVTEEGLLPDSSLLVVIREIPPPRTATEVRSFLGLAGYYRRYVKNFAAIAAPLAVVLFNWSRVKGRSDYRVESFPCNLVEQHCKLPSFRPIGLYKFSLLYLPLFLVCLSCFRVFILVDFTPSFKVPSCVSLAPAIKEST